MTSFKSIGELDMHLQRVRGGFLQIAHRKLDDYPGMVLSILIRWDKKTGHYQLDLEWMCLGLDLYGDTLQESHVYAFASLADLLEQLKTKFDLDLTDLPLTYHFDENAFPNPIKNSQDKLVFQEAWNRFQEDFRNGRVE
jgi:hypothetical protein